jgi:hypothetical protein
MKIEYTLKEVKDNIFAVIVPNDYDRAMLFCRVQEFYESDSEQFKGENFSIWDYMKWYSAKNKGVFTYTKDWSGFNIPFDIAMHFMVPNEVESPYDEEMQTILEKIYSDMKADRTKAYIIGVNSDKGITFKHEMCHALYYNNKTYKVMADTLTSLIPKNYKKIFKDNLMLLGYNESVIDDEIQAYMMTNYNSKYFSKGIATDWMKRTHEYYKEQLNYFLK